MADPFLDEARSAMRDVSRLVAEINAGAGPKNEELAALMEEIANALFRHPREPLQRS